MKTISQAMREDKQTIETTQKEHPFIPFMQVDVISGEVLVDRRAEVCPWLA